MKTFWYFSENNEGGKRRKNWYGYLIQTFSSFFFFSWRREARPQFGGASKHQVPVNFGWEQDRLLSIGNEFIGAALFFSTNKNDGSRYHPLNQRIRKDI